MRYLDLMDQKPHLLVGVNNNLGAETQVHYAPSTKFYLADKRDGKPWITRLPFPVHVVERVETYDRISRNRFVTRYAYHHGYFDGDEREFRGFGMVEQWDTEEFARATHDETSCRSHQPRCGLPRAAGAHQDLVPHRRLSWPRPRLRLLCRSAGRQGRGEYYREPGLTDAQAQTAAPR